MEFRVQSSFLLGKSAKAILKVKLQRKNFLRLFFAPFPYLTGGTFSQSCTKKITFAFTRFAMHFALHLTYAFEAVEVQTGLCNRKHWVLDTTFDFDQRVKLKSARKCSP